MPDSASSASSPNPPYSPGSLAYNSDVPADYSTSPAYAQASSYDSPPGHGSHPDMASVSSPRFAAVTPTGHDNPFGVTNPVQPSHHTKLPRISENFVQFLLYYQDSPEIDPRLLGYFKRTGLLEPGSTRVDKVDHAFRSPTVQRWIADGSRLKEKLSYHDVPDALGLPGNILSQPTEAVQDSRLKRKRPERPTSSLGSSPAKRAGRSQGPKARRLGEQPTVPSAETETSQAQQAATEWVGGGATHQLPYVVSSSSSPDEFPDIGPRRTSFQQELMAESSAVERASLARSSPSEPPDITPDFHSPASFEQEPAPVDILVGPDLPSTSNAGDRPTMSPNPRAPTPIIREPRYYTHTPGAEFFGGPVDAVDTNAEDTDLPITRDLPTNPATSSNRAHKVRPNLGPTPVPAYLRGLGAPPAPPQREPGWEPEPEPEPSVPMYQIRSRITPSWDQTGPPDFSNPVPPKEKVDADELDRAVTRLDRKGWEWERDTKYQGIRQPPLGIRLEHALNFLREEDVDRCRDFTAKLKEVDEWLTWLEDSDPQLMLTTCNTQVLNMFRDARRKVKVHQEFQNAKYGSVSAVPALDPKIPLPKIKRRIWSADRLNTRIRFAGKKDPDELPERYILANRPELVIPPFGGHDETETAHFREKLAEDGELLWTEGETPAPASNLALIEEEAYQDCIREGGPLRQFKTRDGLGGLILPPKEEAKRAAFREGADLTESEKMRRHAVERGARRAALQVALRYFANDEHKGASTEWTRVVLPHEQKYLDEVRRDIDKNHQWSNPQLDRNKTNVKQNRPETMPYTYYWKMQRDLLRNVSEHVLQYVTEKYGNKRGWVNLPKNLVCGGPFVRRMVDPDIEEMQDLLKESEVVLKYLLHKTMRQHEPDLLDENSLRRTIRNGQLDLVEGVEDIARRVANGAYGNPSPGGPFPDGVALVPQDWEDDRRSVKLITADELKWLMFLAGRAMTEDHLSPEEREFKLYSIFAKRLERLANEPTDPLLFRRRDDVRTVEELLNVMNMGCDAFGSKTEFTPFQARYFLERALRQGLVNYVYDAMTYGAIRRLTPEFVPEDRVVLPERGNAVWAVLKYPEHTRPYGDVIKEAHTTGKIEGHSRIAISFLNLAYRLGHTTHRLRQRQEQWKQAKPLSSELMDNAMNAFITTWFTFGHNWETEQYKKFNLVHALSLAAFVDFVDETDFRRMPKKEGFMEDPAAVHDAATEEVALELIRHKIITENHENLTMLGRGREVTYTNAEGKLAYARVPDHNWDWASVAVRGKKRQFFSLDRWPLDMQTAETKQKIQNDEDLDPKMTWDPYTEDPIPEKYYRRKMVGINENEGVSFRPGPAQYLIGDTPMQRKMVQQYMDSLVAEAVDEALGWDPHAGPQTWKEKLASVVPWPSALFPGDDADSETQLPGAHPSLVVKSLYPYAESDADTDTDTDSEHSVEDQDKPMQSIEDDVRMDE